MYFIPSRKRPFELDFTFASSSLLVLKRNTLSFRGLNRGPSAKPVASVALCRSLPVVVRNPCPFLVSFCLGILEISAKQRGGKQYDLSDQ